MVKFQSLSRTLIPLLLAGVTAACQSYQENPFKPDSVYTRTCLERSAPDFPDTVVTLDRIAFEMAIRSPEIGKLKAEAVAAGAVAELWTPYPNPSIEGGVFNFHNTGLSPWEVGPYIMFGFTIPLGRRIYYEDCFVREEAVRTHQKITLAHRQLYLNLRHYYFQSVLASQKRSRCENALLESDSSREKENRLDFLEACDEESQALCELSRLCGIALCDLKKCRFEPLPSPLSIHLPANELDSVLIFNCPELAEIAADNRVQDAAYQLELAKQLPDLVVGCDYAADYDLVQTVGFTVGWELPIFDRNQRAIAEKHATRDAAVKQYQSLLHDKLSTKESLVERIKIARTLLEDEPESPENLARFWENWTTLETTLGYPLFFQTAEGSAFVPPVEPKPWSELYPDSGDPGYVWGIF